MDPLSFTASLVALVSLSATVVNGCYTYIGKARAAPNEIKKIAAEISDLKGILEHLRSLTGDDESRLPSLMSLAGPNGPFESCTSTLQELARKLKSINEASEVRKRLLWPIEGGKLEEILLKVEKHKTTFILALAGDSARSNRQVEDAVTEVQSTLDDMKVQQKRKDVLQWLKGADPSTNHNAARRKHEPDTGDWLLQSDTLELWKKEGSQILWLNGIPGAGKTILSSTVIENLSALCGDGSDDQVAFYYFDFNDHGKQTVPGCLKSLVLQLCVQSKYLHEDVLSLYDDCHAGSRNSTMEELTVILTSLLSRSSRTWVVIDALDECDEDERFAFYSALTEVKSWATGNYNIFITSRPEADIRRELSSLSTFVIDMQNDLVDEDIRSHVRVCLVKDSRLSKWPQPVKKEIEDALTSKASGMFRWAVCQLDVLRKCFKIGNIRKALDGLPLTLNETYERIFKNVPAENIREMRTILMLLAFSTRPMTVQEVSEATAINLETKHFDPEDRFPDPNDILALCSSLVSLVDAGSDSIQVLKREKTATRFGDFGADLKILSFSHFSVKEYVLSEPFRTTAPPDLYISDSISQRYITEICLTYLLEFSGGERVQKFDHEKFPLLAYAGLHWVKHWKAISESNKGDIELLLSRLFDPANLNSFMNFLNLYDPSSEANKPGAFNHGVLFGGFLKRSKEDFASPLRYASYYGLAQIVTWMLSNNNPSKVELAIALGAAGSEGHLEVVKLLLAHGANPNEILPGQGDNPLQSAIHSCNPAVVALILDSGADVLVHRGEQGTALHVAAGEGSTEIIAMLLDHGAEINAWTQSHGTPVTAAAKAGKDLAVSFLVRKGADVNIRGGHYGSTLNTACEFAGIEAVRSIVGAGADITPTALYEAALRAELDTMRLLIPKTKDINAMCGTYGTALQSSIQSRNPASFFLILESGADINIQGGYCGSPIGQAIWSYNPTAIGKLLELEAKFGDSALEHAIDSNADDMVPVAIKLLERGANPNAEQKKFGNVFQFAISKCPKGYMALIQCLLDKGADINAVEGEYGTALQTAVYCDREDIVTILLDYGADMNLQGGEFGTALQAAVVTKKNTIVGLLLERGANVNAIGGRYGCALQAAASTGEMPLVELLLSHGADVNISAGEYVTPLRAAIAKGHVDMIELLLNHGADINVPGEGMHTTASNTWSSNEFNSALEIAAASNNTSIMQMLLDRGADLNKTEAASQSPLSVAVGYDSQDTKMLRFLIENGVDVKKYGGRAILSAVARGLAECVQVLLENGADVNFAIDSFSGSALQECIANGGKDEYVEILFLLLDGGADVNLVSGFYGTALQRAVASGRQFMVLELLKRGADINGAGGNYGTPLGAAAGTGDEELFHLLLERGACVDAKDDNDTSPLRVAISRNYYSMAHELLDRGANVNPKGEKTTPLAAASGYGKDGQLELVKRLLSLGADLEASPIDSRGTALQCAASAGNEPVFKFLLEQGANISARGGSAGNALKEAVGEGHAPMTKLILASGAEVNDVGGEFHTAIQAAAWQGNDDIINSLLDAGADVNIEGGYHGSPLQAASRAGRIRHVKLFLKHGARVNTSTGRYGCPLAAAAKKGNREVVEILLEHGADVNCSGGKYGFPLQAAACFKIRYEGDKGILDLLLQRGADVNAAGGKYGSALQAAAYHHKQHVELLLEHGADVNSQGGKFGSPLKAAREKEIARAVKLLLQHGARDD